MAPSEARDFAMKTLYFVRHGEADYNVLARVNAHPQVKNNLTVTGREQAACARRELAGSGIEIIYCSEFPRTQQTAGILNAALNAPLHVDPRINETGAFAFEGKPVHFWHEAQVPDRISALVEGCESFADMKRRLTDFLDSLRRVPQQRIAVVSHEEPIQIMLGLLQGLPDAQALARPISHCYPVSLPLTR
jgi:broad specificity phosphatase PhoE